MVFKKDNRARRYMFDLRMPNVIGSPDLALVQRLKKNKSASKVQPRSDVHVSSKHGVAVEAKSAPPSQGLNCSGPNPSSTKLTTYYSDVFLTMRVLHMMMVILCATEVLGKARVLGTQETQKQRLIQMGLPTATGVTSGGKCQLLDANGRYTWVEMPGSSADLRRMRQRMAQLKASCPLCRGIGIIGHGDTRCQCCLIMKNLPRILSATTVKAREVVLDEFEFWHQLPLQAQQGWLNSQTDAEDIIKRSEHIIRGQCQSPYLPIDKQAHYEVVMSHLREFADLTVKV